MVNVCLSINVNQTHTGMDISAFAIQGQFLTKFYRNASLKNQASLYVLQIALLMGFSAAVIKDSIP